jgi:lathosterol oxidase
VIIVIVHITLVFIVLFLLNYLVPVALTYYILYKRRGLASRTTKLQNKVAGKAQIRTEILNSARATLVNAVMVYVVIRLIIAGHSKMYFDWDAYGVLYFILSPLICVVLHDTYFYWMHRMLHLPVFFRRIHLTHHKSITPTPWASYSFSMADSFMNTLLPVSLVFIIPIHYVAILVFFTINMVVNIYGHSGYEVRGTPKGLFAILNKAADHDKHHTHFNGNYGLYFNLWDRLMHTHLPATDARPQRH